MKKKGVNLSDEISKRGLGWNIIHYICKYNSSKCL